MSSQEIASRLPTDCVNSILEFVCILTSKSKRIISLSTQHASAILNEKDNFIHEYDNPEGSFGFSTYAFKKYTPVNERKLWNSFDVRRACLSVEHYEFYIQRSIMVGFKNYNIYLDFIDEFGCDDLWDVICTLDKILFPYDNTSDKLMRRCEKTLISDMVALGYLSQAEANMLV